MPSRLVLATVAVLIGLEAGCGGLPPSRPDTSKGSGGKATDTEKGALGDLQRLLDTIPDDHKPKADRKAVIELDKANHWLKTFAAGKTIELTCKVEAVSLKPDPNQSGRYAYSIKVGEEIGYDFEGANAFGLYVAGKVKIGGADWTTCINVVPNGRAFALPSAGEADAKRLKEMEGKTVRMKGTIEAAKFDLFPVLSKRFVPRLEFDLVKVTIDGFDTQKK